MQLQILIDEGMQLAKHCVLLTPRQNDSVQTAALWSLDPIRREIILDCAFFPASELKGTLTISEVDLANDAISVIHNPDQLLPFKAKHHLELQAKPALCPTPIEAIFRLGSSRVEEWLDSFYWRREWEYNSNFGGKSLVEEYQQFCRNYLSFDGVYAMLGGWNMLFPERHFDEIAEHKLIALTFEDPEPYIEVTLSEQGQFVANALIT